MSTAASNELTTTLADLPRAVGRRVGEDDWREMTQDEVTRFADLTGDHNFIHVDPQRAAQTPFGGTIAHGFLSLALVAKVSQGLTVTDAATAVNYGLDKVRFPGPLPVGAHWRGHAEITEVTEIPGGAQVRMTATIEVRDRDRPAVVAECLVRFYA